MTIPHKIILNRSNQNLSNKLVILMKEKRLFLLFKTLKNK